MELFGYFFLIVGSFYLGYKSGSRKLEERMNKAYAYGYSKGTFIGLQTPSVPQ